MTFLNESLVDDEDTKENLGNLIEQLNTALRVIPFVGAGLSIPFGFPGWGAFLLQQAARAGIPAHIEQLLNAADYETAAAALLTARGYRAFQDAISNTFGRRQWPKEPLTGPVRLLAQLTTGPLITTNFDHVLEEAFQQAATPFEYIVWGVKVDLATKALQQNRRFLLKLHGDADDSTERILTTNDYQKQYGSVDGTTVDLSLPLPRLIQQMLISRPLLFLGCSLHHDRIVTVLDAVMQSFPASAHYAIVERPQSSAAFYERARFLSEHSIRPIWYPHGEHAALATILEQLIAASTASPKEQVTAGAPTPDDATGTTVTDAVRFDTERKPRTIDLQRAIHKIAGLEEHAARARVPLAYDHRLSQLLANLEMLYSDFEQRMEEHGAKVDAHDFSAVQSARVNIPARLRALPDVVGLVILRLCRSALAQSGFTDVQIATTTATFIELVLTDILHVLAGFQFHSDSAKLLSEYTHGYGVTEEYVARISGVPVESLVSYRMLFVGDAQERIVIAPRIYGGEPLRVLREFMDQEPDYFPPLSFMTQYVLPQMFTAKWNQPNEWNIEWKCTGVFVKDLQGNYLDWHGNA